VTQPTTSHVQRSMDEQASAWLLTLQTEELSVAQRAEFVDWLRDSPQHIASMLRICQLQRGLSTFRGWEQICRGDVQPAEVVALLAAPARKRGGQPRHLLRTATSLAASVAVLCVIAVIALGRLGRSEYRTQNGERREVTLSDGSIFDLAPHSDLEVRYKKRERLITLVDGEALFRVAKNPNRPFIVQAASTQVRAVGTVFNVESGSQGVSVTVVEGRVAVSQQRLASFKTTGSALALPVLALGANQQVSVTRDGVTSNVRSVASTAETGWAADQIVFENETVAEVAGRFNLHNRTKIEVQDPGLSQRRISGVFQANDPQSFVTFIEATAGARVSQPDSTHILVGADSTPPP
jgi:transmembrane sensor